MNDTPNTAPTPEVDNLAFTTIRVNGQNWKGLDKDGGYVAANDARTLERQRNAALADNAKLQAELDTHMRLQDLLGAEFEGADDVEECVTRLRAERDEAQVACVAKDEALTEAAYVSTDTRFTVAAMARAALNPTCSQPILVRIKAMEDALAEFINDAHGLETPCNCGMCDRGRKALRSANGGAQ